MTTVGLPVSLTTQVFVDKDEQMVITKAIDDDGRVFLEQKYDINQAANLANSLNAALQSLVVPTNGGKGLTEVLINPAFELVVLKVTDANGKLKAVISHDAAGTESLIHDLTKSLEALRIAVAKKGQG